MPPSAEAKGLAVPLQPYLAGVFLWQCHQLFEACMTPAVKKHMLAKFGGKWLEKCAEACGSKTKGHLNDDGHPWDVHKLTQVIKGFMEDVFAPALSVPDLERNDLFRSVGEIHNLRNTRAKPKVYGMPPEREVLQAISRMEKVLRRFQEPAAAQKMAGKLKEAKRLHRLAREAKAAATPATAAVTIPNTEFQVLVFYLASADFEARLTEQVGEFEFKDQTVAFGKTFSDQNQKRDEQYAQERIASGQPEEKVDKKFWSSKITASNEAFRAFCDARHWFYHSTSATPDFAGVVGKMGERLVALDGFKDGKPPRKSTAEIGW